tara:strand:+ start:279 stop:746 length:468 start_codon:yes stop_codon:yes gene_type:complete
MLVCIRGKATVENEFRCVIQGEPASAKNQRRIIKVKGSPRIIKSAKAMAYSREFQSQCVPMEEPYECDVSLQVNVWYASRRPDLACIDLVQDLLQGYAYKNDRQVKASMALWGLDKGNPRCEIIVKPLPEFQSSLGVSSLPLSAIWDHPMTEQTE